VDSPHIASHATPAEPAGGSSSTGALLVTSLRPHQWTKNFFVFAGLVFGQRLGDLDAILGAVSTFAVFCGLSGAVYLYNDVQDRQTDRQHPIKRHRPVASGALSPRTTIAVACVLAVAGLAAAWLIAPSVGIVAAAYVTLLSLYSAFLKHVVIVDVLVVATGFVLRALAGAIAVSVPMSSWLFICTTLLALFVVLNKRRHELTLLTHTATSHRKSLQDYSPYLLDQMITLVGASTLIAYSVYTMGQETIGPSWTPWFWLTIPFVLYGLLRYLYLVHRKGGGGNPDRILFTNRPLLACVACWATSVIAILYVGR
jgi:4-hydroxybenzoate polyprenyltransferase